MGRAKEIQVETWITRDKINRYRGILKLHARDKKLQQSQAAKLKSIVSKKITFLEVDVLKQREIINDLSSGKRRALRTLSDHRELRLAFNHLQPSEICAVLYQNSDDKRRILDKLYYEKKRRLRRVIELRLEREVLSTDYEEESEELLSCKEQRLVGQLQQSVAKYNTAKAVYSAYCSMLNILKKDAIFFDTQLSVLKEDQSSQCTAMLRVTMMGQLATENLDDVRQKYKRMTRVVWHNMKIREHTLNTVRLQVQDLWTYAQSLVRIESDAVLKKETDESAADKMLASQLVNLEDICDQVKEALLVRSYHDLLSRLEDQSTQKTNLLARLNANLKNRDSLLSKRNQALQVLETLKHSMKAVTEQYKINERDILEQIEIEKKREKHLKEVKKAHSELLTNIKAALQSMNTILYYVKLGDRVAKKAAKNGNKKELDDKEDVEEREVLPKLEEIDTDVLVLLSKISRKAGILFGMSNFDIDKHKEDKARDLYQTYVSNYSSNLIFGRGEEESIGLFVEHEVIDITVPTRADIKLRSRQIMEAHLKPE